MKKHSTVHRILSAVLSLILMGLQPVLAASAGTQPALTGHVMAAVSTNLDSEIRKNSSFSSEDVFLSNALQEEGLTQVFDRYIDEATGEELTVLSRSFPSLTQVYGEDIPENEDQPQLMASYQIGSTKTVLDVDGGSHNVQCLYIGAHCTVWGSCIDDAAVAVTAQHAAQIGQQFDTFYPTTVDAFGTYHDTDKDGKVAIFCYDIENNYPGSVSAYTAGFFRPSDLVSAIGYLGPFYVGKSNYTFGMDSIHLDTYPTMGYSEPMSEIEGCYPTLVHEFQHLINYSHILTGKSLLPEMELYLNEAFSMAAEHIICGSDSTEGRVTYFNAPGRYTPGTSLCCWSGSLSNYSNSYLFGQYIRTRYGQLTGGDGSSIYKKVLTGRVDNTDTLALIAQLLNTTPKQLVCDFWGAVYTKADTGVLGFAGEEWAGDIQPYIYPSVTSGSRGIYNGGVKYYTLPSGGFTPSSYSGLAFLDLGEPPVIVPRIKHAAMIRTAADEAVFSGTPNVNGTLYYALSQQEITDPENLQDTLSVTAGTEQTVTFSLPKEEAAEYTLYYYLLDQNNNKGKLTALPLPAYTYPITVISPERGTVAVTLDGEAVQNGDRVRTGSVLQIEATADPGFEIEAITVDGKDLSGTALTVSAAHTIAVRIRPSEGTESGSIGETLRWAMTKQGPLFVHSQIAATGCFAVYEPSGRMKIYKELPINQGENSYDLAETASGLQNYTWKLMLLDFNYSPLTKSIPQ